MNLALATLVVLAAAAVAITAILLVRRGGARRELLRGRRPRVRRVRRAGDRLLGPARSRRGPRFTSFDASRAGAEDEALTVAQQFETAQLMPAPAGRRLAAELVCYARSVVHQEWPRMEDGTLGEGMNEWGATMFHTLQTVEPRTAAEQTAYDKWIDQRTDREAGRSARIHGAVGVIPAPLWIVLFVIAIFIFGFMLFFADSGEPALVQATLIGTVVAAITAILLVIDFLDSPFRPGVGSLRPVAMERTLRVLDQERRLLGHTSPVPCDAHGVAIRSS